MVTVTSMSNLDYGLYDEVWAIVRSLKYANPKVRHVPELSPSWSLFKKYLDLRDKGDWNAQTFRRVYVPQFLKEMREKGPQDLLNALFSTKKHICLVCFCPDEELCHRSIIGGMLQGAGLEMRGLSKDYSHYFNWWKNGVPGMPGDGETAAKKVSDYNQNTEYLYGMADYGISSLFDGRTLCFTGRRPKDLCWYDMAKYRSFVDDLSELIYDEFYEKRGIRTFVSGGAQGFDQMAFWAVEKMKKVHGCSDAENIVFVPFEGQELRWAKTGLFSQAEYWMMVKAADAVAVICKDNSIGSLFERNEAMCACSDACLALYPDDGWQVAKGGTASCMRHAAEHCREFYRLGYFIDGAGLHMDGLKDISGLFK